MGDFYARHRFGCHLGAQVAVFVALLLAGRVAGVDQAETEYLALQASVGSTFASDQTAPPDASSADRAEETARGLSQTVRLLESRLAYRRAPERSADRIGEDRNRFAEALNEARRALDELALSGRVVAFPGELGFGQQMPGPAEIPVALTRLDAVVHVVSSAIRAGVIQVQSIEFRAPVRSRDGYVQEIPVKFGVRGTSRSVARLLQDLAASPTYLSMGEARLASRAGADEVELTIVLSALELDPAATGLSPGSGPGSPGGGTPARTIDDIWGRR